MTDYNETVSDIQGFLVITSRNKETGEIVDKFEDKNLFLNLGRSNMLRAISTLASDDYVIKDLRFGTDFGDPVTYDKFNPEPAQLTFDSTTQDVLFTISYPTLSHIYPDYKSIKFSCVLDGSAILDLFPGEVDVQYNSVALYNTVDNPFAYRRFPVKSLSRLISVTVEWTISFAT